MKDNLEQFIEANREAFDTHEPPQGLWQDICDELDNEPAFPMAPQLQPERKPWLQRVPATLLQVAAAVAFLVASYFVLQQPAANNSQLTGDLFTALKAHPDAEAQLAKVDPELANEAAQFTEQLTTLQQTLAKEATPEAGVDAELQKEFANELAELDSQYLALNRELSRSADPEAIALAMVHNLQLRIDVLKRQRQLLKQIRDQNDTQAQPQAAPTYERKL